MNARPVSYWKLLNVSLVIWGAASLVGAVLIAAGGSSDNTADQLHLDGIETKASVERLFYELDARKSGQVVSRYWVHYRFRDQDNREHERVVVIAPKAWSALEEGGVIAVKYLPREPSVSVPTTKSAATAASIFPRVIQIGGAALIAFALAHLYFDFKRAQNLRWVAAHGARATGRVAGLRWRRRSLSHRVVAAFNDDHGNHRLAYSRYRSSEASVQKLRGQEIEIVFDPYHSETAYWLDEISEPD